ncbi:hypothetical protein [uncultured Duncaniella sp.]|uniref:hypothetical protein n=1 Tax=uncultured Duncaniella sp. TaxID=2768039 RepID=UPI002675CC13|nr:hypothetical protein [uncultured Duncaniella sp.]
MKLKKIALYYREMSQYEDSYPEEVGNIVVFKTKEGGYGIRRQCHGWKEGDTIWTSDGTQPTRVIAVAEPKAIEDLLQIFRNATYIVNRFDNMVDRQRYLDRMEAELLKAAA